MSSQHFLTLVFFFCCCPDWINVGKYNSIKWKQVQEAFSNFRARLSCSSCARLHRLRAKGDRQHKDLYQRPRMTSLKTDGWHTDNKSCVACPFCRGSASLISTFVYGQSCVPQATNNNTLTNMQITFLHIHKSRTRNEYPRRREKRKSSSYKKTKQKQNKNGMNEACLGCVEWCPSDITRVHWKRASSRHGNHHIRLSVFIFSPLLTIITFIFVIEAKQQQVKNLRKGNAFALIDLIYMCIWHLSIGLVFVGCECDMKRSQTMAGDGNDFQQCPTIRRTNIQLVDSVRRVWGNEIFCLLNIKAVRVKGFVVAAHSGAVVYRANGQFVWETCWPWPTTMGLVFVTPNRKRNRSDKFILAEGMREGEKWPGDGRLWSTARQVRLDIWMRDGGKL